MNKAKKTAKKIKDYLIGLALKDEFPADLNALDTQPIVDIITEEDDEINMDTIISGTVCNECKEEIPPHSVEQHLDPKFMEHFHKCPTPLEKGWNEKARAFFVGKTIIQARYMTKAEADGMGWYKRPLIFIFDDGSYMFSSMDDEGNDGGAIFGQTGLYADEGGLVDFPVL